MNKSDSLWGASTDAREPDDEFFSLGVSDATEDGLSHVETFLKSAS